MRISDWSSDVCSSDLLGSTGDHVLHIVSVTRAVNMRVVTDIGVVLYVSGVDGDTASLLFRRAIDLVEVDTSGAENFGAHASQSGRDRKSVVSGKSVSVRVDTGGSRINKKKKNE